MKLIGRTSQASSNSDSSIYVSFNDYCHFIYLKRRLKCTFDPLIYKLAILTLKLLKWPFWSTIYSIFFCKSDAPIAFDEVNTMLVTKVDGLCKLKVKIGDLYKLRSRKCNLA